MFWHESVEELKELQAKTSKAVRQRKTLSATRCVDVWRKHIANRKGKRAKTIQMYASDFVVTRWRSRFMKIVTGYLDVWHTCSREMRTRRALIKRIVVHKLKMSVYRALARWCESIEAVENKLMANKALESQKTELLVLVSIHLPNEYLKYIAAQLVALQQQMKPELDDKIKKMEFAINTLRQVVSVCACMCSLQACTHTREFAWHAYCMIMMNLP